MNAVQAQMRAQIQADEDKRIFEVMDGLGQESVHLVNFLLENSGMLVSEYYPHGQVCTIRMVSQVTMGAIAFPSSGSTEIVCIKDNGKKSWTSHVPNSKKLTNTAFERLCFHVAHLIYEEKVLAAKYYERERNNFLWRDFWEETRRAALVASMMEM